MYHMPGIEHLLLECMEFLPRNLNHKFDTLRKYTLNH
jgi:hypothetical protein